MKFALELAICLAAVICVSYPASAQFQQAVWGTLAAGLEQSHNFIIEYYDCRRFKGMGNPESELDIYVPIR
jgi:predicted transcriptional regulator YdeE